MDNSASVAGTAAGGGLKVITFLLCMDHFEIHFRQLHRQKSLDTRQAGQNSRSRAVVDQVAAAGHVKHIARERRVR